MGDYEHAVEVELGITEGWEDNSSRADDGLVT